MSLSGLRNFFFFQLGTGQTGMLTENCIDFHFLKQTNDPNSKPNHLDGWQQRYANAMEDTAVTILFLNIRTNENIKGKWTTKGYNRHTCCSI